MPASVGNSPFYKHTDGTIAYKAGLAAPGWGPSGCDPVADSLGGC